MKLRSSIVPLHPRTVFRISRARRTEVRNVFVRVEGDGVAGYGEASPNAFYGESADAVKERLDSAAPRLAGRRVVSPEDIREMWEECWETLAPSRAAQCALDVALWDLAAKRRGIAVAEMAFGEAPRPVRSFATIGLSEPDELAAKIRELRDFPLVKLKSGRGSDAETASRVLAGTAALIAIDANGGWRADEVVARCREVAETAGSRLLFVEQPLPPTQDAEMAGILPDCPVPVIADESCVTQDDVGRLAGRFSGFNVKLVKCGGLTPALEMLRRGRELGLRTMVGCMLESSLLISAGAVVAQRADYADLDGAWLIRDDPFEGLPFEKGVLTLRAAPGLEVEPAQRCAGFFGRGIGGFGSPGELGLSAL